tara:strand:+ start:677076 stop:677804 length:729 start_codon:yes stop_codon:yes gene_type:complete
MRLLLLTFVFLTSGLTLTAQEVSYVSKGEAFPASGGNRALFTFEKGTKVDGPNQIYFEHFTDGNGKPATELEATYQSGKLIAVRFDQLQLGETSTAVVKNGKVTFSHTNSTGKTKQSVADAPADLNATPVIPQLITANWATLTNGKAVEFTVPIPARLRSFSVKLTMERTWSEGGRQYSEFKLVPSNVVFRAIADPRYFVFDNQTKVFCEYRGGTVAKTGQSGKWKDFSSRIAYQPAEARKR